VPGGAWLLFLVLSSADAVPRVQGEGKLFPSPAFEGGVVEE